MEFKTLREMIPEYNNTVNYSILIGEETIQLNQMLGNKIRIAYNGTKNCIFCWREIKKKTYNQGYCYPCFRDLAENDICIVKPHLCHFHEGTCRDEDFGKKNCFSEHYVYLSLTSDVKVGITRKKTLKKRWMDQGAVEAIPIALVPDRRTAGLIEDSLTEYLKDKTDWRKMLKGESMGDLYASYDLVKDVIGEEYKKYLVNNEIAKISYPYAIPKKLKSLDLEKNQIIEAKLHGIKGQYLILEDGVLNIRKHRGFNCIIKSV